MSLKALLVGFLLVIVSIPDESDAYPWYWGDTTDIDTITPATEIDTTITPSTATIVRTTPTPPDENPTTVHPKSEATAVTSVTSGQTPNNSTNNNNNNNNSNNNPIKKIDRGTDISLNIKVPRQTEEKRDPNRGPLMEMLLSVNDI
ncbi:hypothetical protein BsWGS_09112 [Bradybaena similaris]